jgi:DNA (cytosine-5)-methyltransferase 1
MVTENHPTVISLFTGAMGLDIGFELEGFDIRVALDINKDAIATIKKNRPNIPIIENNIFNVKTTEILTKAKLKIGEATVVTGGPPCQPFSTAGRRESVSEEEGTLVFQFLRVIKETQPMFFVFENVSGLISAARKHVSFYERIKKKETELAPEERLGSAFERLIAEFKKIKSIEGGFYGINHGVVNCADYGVPQKRKRFIMLGSRTGIEIQLPPTTHASPKSPDVISCRKRPWVTLREALKDLDDPHPEYTPFPRWGKYMKYIPEGGCWRDLPKELLKEAMLNAYDEDKKKDVLKGGRTGFYRRLAWDKPSPTILTSPNFKGSVLGHPELSRPLSVREYARIQQFPNEWEFVDHIETKYRLIGEAVPVPLGRAIAVQVKAELGEENCTNKGQYLECVKKQVV